MNGRSKGFGFVEMEDEEAAKAAIAGIERKRSTGSQIDR